MVRAQPLAVARTPVDSFDRSSTAQRVAGVLRERIAGADMAPGTRIVELDVAGELKVSRSPVREALRILAQEGLVAIVPYRGAFVTPLHRQHFVELTEFRLALERFALDRLLQRDSPAHVVKLNKHLGVLRAAVKSANRSQAIQADLALHRAMVDMAGNALLARTYESLLAQIRLYIDVTSARYARLEELADEHAALIEAIRSGAAARARRLLDAHILHGFADGAPGQERRPAKLRK